ncbi:hypothetical protein [Metabacillus halosaccharovorans]|uniref:Uncharacterized protein n=1 Tax=Metabacillus halosaccharovorans TaxID=930124 RepID=A0ABT3DCI9_9BACI|nr:hypothetical protein [Metabacillus halosaccharovorans]MCV9884763.1 hypothetical protein [Metabacillus halosaccharovorans]
MKGQELTNHLQYVQKLLLTLMNSYEEFQSRKTQLKKLSIPLKQHVIYIIVILTAILIATLTISSFLKVERSVLFLIISIQMVLAISVYVVVMKGMTLRVPTQEEKKEQKAISSMSFYELDQLRFKILQDLAKSPIPPTHMTRSSIEKMLKLVESGKCVSLEECLTSLNKEAKKQKHMEELEIMKHLQMISYH